MLAGAEIELGKVVDSSVGIKSSIVRACNVVTKRSGGVRVLRIAVGT